MSSQLKRSKSSASIVGWRPIKTGKLFDFSSFDQERHSRIINIPCWLRVNVPAIIISIITYLGLSTFCGTINTQNLDELLTWQNFLAFYFFGAIRGYFYVIYLYFVFRDRQKYFTQIHKEMEDGRSFWGHVLSCCARTGYSAILMHIFNIFGTLYFYGVEDEFTPEVKQHYSLYGAINLWMVALMGKKLLYFVAKMFLWEIFFDFGHYWGHRLGHHFQWLYNFGHGVHHESICPDAWDGM